MRKILVVVGTRPEAIKMAPLIRRLQAVPEVAVTVCSTGQHREMIHQVFQLFSITPDVDLDVMQPGQRVTCRERRRRSSGLLFRRRPTEPATLLSAPSLRPLENRQDSLQFSIRDTETTRKHKPFWCGLKLAGWVNDLVASPQRMVCFGKDNKKVEHRL